MPTNYPTSLDTLGAVGTIGGPFVDAAPPVDPFVDIAADFRSNLNDAMLAVQTRVGLTNDTNPASLSWATISEGGVGNLGLRFAQDETQWPGAVGESGIFLKDGTLEPMFHRAGEAKATFYPMLGGGGGGTLQDAYDASADPAYITLAGTKNLLFQTTAAGGIVQIIDSGSTFSFLTANEPLGEVYLGDGTNIKVNVSGRVSSDIVFDSVARFLTNNNDDLSLQTLGTGNISFLSASNIAGLAASGGIFLTGAADKVELRGTEMDLASTAGDTFIHSTGFVEFQTGSGEAMHLLTGSDDPSSVAKDANRGSVYLRDSGVAGELYVKQDDGSSTNWTELGAGGATGTLQDAYDNSGSPAVIAMSGGAKHLNFRTSAAGASFIVSDQADVNILLSADESSGEVRIGSGSTYAVDINGQVNSNITFDGAPHLVTNDGAPLTVQTTTSGNLNLIAAQKLDGSGTSIDLTSSTAEITLVSAGAIDVQTGGGGGETMRILTGTDDPTAVAKWAYRGSLYLRDTGAVGQLYVKQDDGSSTNWSLLSGGAGAVTLQDAYNNGPNITTAGPNDIKFAGPENFIFEAQGASAQIQVLSMVSCTDAQGLLHLTHDTGVNSSNAATFETVNQAGNNGRELGTVHAEVHDLSDLDAGDVIHAYSADVQMSGDATGPLPSVGAAFWAQNATFAGVGPYFSSALYVDSSYDTFLYSNTGNALIVHMSDGETMDIGADTSVITTGGTNSDMLAVTQYAKSILARGVHVSGQIGPTNAGGLGTGGHNFLSDYTAGGFPQALLGGAGYFLYKAEGSTHLDDNASAWEYGYHADFTIPSSGGSALADVGCSVIGAYVNVPESYDGVPTYHNNDGFFTFARWAFYAEQGESKFRRTEFEGPVDLNKPLVRFRQADEAHAFHHLYGGSSNDPLTPTANLTTLNLGASVVGPLNTTWSFLGMYQVYVTDSKGTIPNGHYWVPLYQAV